MQTHKVLLAGHWQDSNTNGVFQAENPRTKEPLGEHYPISHWDECSAALDAAQSAFIEMLQMPRETIAGFLESYADRIEARTDEICELAHIETALPVEPRLAKIELPRTTFQIRESAKSARSGDWCMPVNDEENKIYSCYGPIGPVAVFGPNNFPLAFGGISGGDFASAIAAGNPVIAKAHPLHPGTTRLLAEEAQIAADETGMPAGTVQLVYGMDYSDGERLVKDSRLAAVAFTGSRHGGLALKAAADSVGKPIYLEMSSINPIVILPGALEERGEEIATELSGSCMMAAGQFCTSPGLVIVQAGAATEQFVNSTVEKFKVAPIGTLLSKSGEEGLAKSLQQLVHSGAETLAGDGAGGGQGYSHSNTLLRVSGEEFLDHSGELQTEAFGNACMIVVSNSPEQTVAIVRELEGNLTGCIYSHTDGSDDAAYQQVALHLRLRVGRLLNDKMPTGVAVSPAMNHGGPYPATGHPGFTAVGVPAAIRRFAMLQCFDNVREHRLPGVFKQAAATT